MFHFPLYMGRRSRELVWRGVSIYTSRSQISWVGTSSASSFMYVYVTDDGNLMTNVISGRSQANVTTMTDNDEEKK